MRSADGTLWLKGSPVHGVSATWLLVAPGGTARGTLDLPAATRVAWSDESTAWLVVADELEVPWLVRIRFG